ncbi:MAG: hypothetical protein IJ400_02630 [Clostridia bacterium]|nr:hypothetical protein [Clostridia bacterium]
MSFDINVSVSDINSYIYSIGSALNEMSEDYESTIEHGRKLLERAGTSLNNAKDSLENMNKDLRLVEEVLENNKLVQDRYIEERKEIDSLAYENECEELINLKKEAERRCGQIAKDNETLEKARSDINNGINEVQKYCNNLQKEINQLEDALKAFDKGKKSIEKDIDTYREDAEHAKGYIKSALQCFSEASGEGKDAFLYSGTIEMDGTGALGRFINTLKDVYEENASACKRMENSTRDFGDRLSGDVRDAVVEKTNEICQNIEKVNKGIEQNIGLLMDAKKYLDHYLKLKR